MDHGQRHLCQRRHEIQRVGTIPKTRQKLSYRSESDVAGGLLHVELGYAPDACLSRKGSSL